MSLYLLGKYYWKSVYVFRLIFGYAKTILWILYLSNILIIITMMKIFDIIYGYVNLHEYKK